MAVDYRVKLILCGDTYVGKSSLMTRFSNSSKFNELKTTIGVDYSTRDVTFTHARTHAPIVVAAQVWDTAGQERFRAIASAYYRGTDGALMVFDVTDDGSFKRLDTWVDDLRRFDLWRRGVPIVLVGNKIDLLETHERRVPRETALEYARANGLSYVETSALTNDHVDDAFIALLTNIMRRLDVTSVAPCDRISPRAQRISGHRVGADSHAFGARGGVADDV